MLENCCNRKEVVRKMKGWEGCLPFLYIYLKITFVRLFSKMEVVDVCARIVKPGSHGAPLCDVLAYISLACFPHNLRAKSFEEEREREKPFLLCLTQIYKFVDAFLELFYDFHFMYLQNILKIGF